jgi:hypothetical protein
MIIISNFRVVDKAILSVDQDRTVCETLTKIHREFGDEYQLAFANGGDQTNDTIPERPICEKLGIRLIDNLAIKSNRLLGIDVLKEFERTWNWGCYFFVYPLRPRFLGKGLTRVNKHFVVGQVVEHRLVNIGNDSKWFFAIGGYGKINFCFRHVIRLNTKRMVFGSIFLPIYGVIFSRICTSAAP